MSCCVTWPAVGDPAEPITGFLFKRSQCSRRGSTRLYRFTFGEPWSPGEGRLAPSQASCPEVVGFPGSSPSVLGMCRESLLSPRCPWLTPVFLSPVLSVTCGWTVSGGRPPLHAAGQVEGAPSVVAAMWEAPYPRLPAQHS